MTELTTVHLLRHGEVHNPEGILYGRTPGFHLSDLGVAMAARVAETIKGRDIVHLASSPLERAQETARPVAEALGLPILLEERIIESTNIFEGKPFALGEGVLFAPSAWRHLWNPFRPSWGEPYRQVAVRMRAAVKDAQRVAAGHEAVLVSHQLPIWIARLSAQGRPFFHDPRRRECTLASLTSFHFRDGVLTHVSYSEPAGDLIPVRDKRAPFSAGGAPEDRRP